MSPCCAVFENRPGQCLEVFQSMEAWILKSFSGAGLARPPISLAPKPNSPTKAVRYSSKRLPSRSVSCPSCVTRLLLWCIQWCWKRWVVTAVMGCDGLHTPKASKHAKSIQTHFMFLRGRFGSLCFIPRFAPALLVPHHSLGVL